MICLKNGSTGSHLTLLVFQLVIVYMYNDTYFYVFHHCNISALYDVFAWWEQLAWQLEAYL